MSARDRWCIVRAHETRGAPPEANDVASAVERRPPIALDVGAPVVDVAGAPRGCASADYESWWNERPEAARPWWGSTLRESSYPNGNSSGSGCCVAVTPFGRAVVRYQSVGGRLYLYPLRGESGGWEAHAAYSASVHHDAAMLVTVDWRSARLARPAACPCWRCAGRRAEAVAASSMRV